MPHIFLKSSVAVSSRWRALFVKRFNELKKTEDDEKRNNHDRRVRQIGYTDRYRRYMDDGSGNSRIVRHYRRSGKQRNQGDHQKRRPTRLRCLQAYPSGQRQQCGRV